MEFLSTSQWFLDFFPLLMFPGLLLCIMSGYPVAFCLAGCGILFGLLGVELELMRASDFGFVPQKIYGIITNFTLLAVPLFIFMGITLEKTGIAEELLSDLEKIFYRLRGGLAITVIMVGALLAASTGIVGATVVTMGLLTLPSMLKRSYNIELSTGVIAASGTLGQIIPPSIVLILLGDMMNVAVAELFAAAIFPGLLLVALYVCYVIIRVGINPELTPLPPVDENRASVFTLCLKLLTSLIPVLALIVLVLGSILLGIASPTESAACGAAGALVIAVFKWKLSPRTLFQIAEETSLLSAMVFGLLIGAQIFAVVFRGLDGDFILADVLTSISDSPNTILIVVMLMLFVLGFFLDFLEICFIVVPLVTPILVGDFGFNPLWLAILIAINLQTSFLTPPFGFALFYLKGVAPKEVTSGHIYRGIIPFVIIQLIVLLAVAFFPVLSTYLPKVLLG